MKYIRGKALKYTSGAVCVMIPAYRELFSLFKAHVLVEKCG